jgi:hypothetical protein
MDRRTWSPLVIVTLCLLTAACSNTSSHNAGATSPTTQVQPSTVKVTYVVTSRSTPNDQGSIVYTDPTNGIQVPIPGQGLWADTWQIPANQPTLLQVKVIGPYTDFETRGIFVNNQRATGQSGQPGEAGRHSPHLQLHAGAKQRMTLCPYPSFRSAS